MDVTLVHLTSAAQSLSRAFDSAFDRQDAPLCQAVSRAAASTALAIEMAIEPRSGSGGTARTATNHLGFEIGGEA